MTLSLYDVSIPALVHGLRQLSHLVDKAQAHATAGAIDSAALVGARLAEDMFPFSAQVQRASDTAKGTGFRLSDVAAPSLPDTEQTFDELRARIATTVTYLQSLTPGQVDGNEAKAIRLTFGKLKADFTGTQYLVQFGLPNFYFHVTTAYAILRNQGVQVGKLDYIGPVGTVVVED